MLLNATTEAAAAIVKKGKRRFLWSNFFVWVPEIDCFVSIGQRTRLHLEPPSAQPFSELYKAAFMPENIKVIGADSYVAPRTWHHSRLSPGSDTNSRFGPNCLIKNGNLMPSWEGRYDVAG
jgi:hypothetical protein